ncbi:MAG: radical SAM protein [Bacteroidales bacterium]|nr:radical SAM protein [Bacteroidales bacterium]
MYDKFNRKINYLRVSVTDRCNLRCTYCMPAEGVELMHHTDILRFHEIVETIEYAVSQGVDKVRITGGEPLVRKGITDLVAMISKIKGIKDFGMTTNGVLLDKYAQPLADAGLHRVNISLDTMNPEKYHQITRLGDINQVFKGIEAAKKAGLTPIKINCVISETSKEPDTVEVAEFCKKNDLQIRYIKEMNLETGSFSTVQGGTGGNCSICNRLRLTAKGDILPCLFSDAKYNIRELGIKKAFKKALVRKPKNGHIAKESKFYNVGG